MEGCRITRIGMDYYSAAAIFIDNALARNNYIEDTPYSGIVAYGDNVVIENNIVLDPMQTLNDGAAIYKLLDKKGIIRNNFVQRRKGNKSLNCKGLYLDAPGVDFIMSGNVVKGFNLPFHHHIGEPGTVWKDNYFETDGDMLLTFHRTQGSHLVNNIFRCTGRFQIAAPLGAIVEFRSNIIRHSGEMVEFIETVPDAYRAIKPAAPLEADSSNSIERNLV